MLEAREDCIKLLGPEVATLEPYAFYDRIVGLFQPRVTGGKAKEVDIKGKKLKAPSKKTMGIYEMRYPTALGERALCFTFDKRGLFREDLLKTVCEHLLCAEQKVLSFLEKKKFTVSSCLDDELKLQEIKLALSEEKETKDDSSTG